MALHLCLQASGRDHLNPPPYFITQRTNLHFINESTLRASEMARIEPTPLTRKSRELSPWWLGQRQTFGYPFIDVIRTVCAAESFSVISRIFLHDFNSLSVSFHRGCVSSMPSSQGCCVSMSSFSGAVSTRVISTSKEDLMEPCWDLLAQIPTPQPPGALFPTLYYAFATFSVSFGTGISPESPLGQWFRSLLGHSMTALAHAQ